jgi:hypothetical protein
METAPVSFSKPNIPDTSAELRQQEAERAARVRAGSAEVNTIFDQKFGPQYYKGIGDAFRDYYKPQVADKFGEAERKTTFRYADNAGSSAANRTFADLYRDKLRADSDVESGAYDAQNNAKQDVEAKRGNLINFVEAGSSLENSAAQARAAASTDIGRPTFSPIGDIFAKYANTVSAAARASDSGQQVNPFFQRQVDFLRGNPGGSQRIVGGG